MQNFEIIEGGMSEDRYLHKIEESFESILRETNPGKLTLMEKRLREILQKGKPKTRPAKKIDQVIGEEIVNEIVTIINQHRIDEGPKGRLKRILKKAMRFISRK